MIGRPSTGEDSPLVRFRLPRWLAILSGITGTILGFATNLYSENFRKAISESGHVVNSTTVSILVTTIVASASTAIIYRWLSRRRILQQTVLPGEIKIDSKALRSVSNEQDAVVGRSLRYLETKRESNELIVFLHGLGLDANDFRPYMVESKLHCIALTLFGFNASERDDPYYKPISLESHVQLVSYALELIHGLYPHKRITLVGFSFGADVILFLSQFTPGTASRLRIHRAVLLDPNVNHTTTTISSRIAVVDRDRPLTELVKILESASNVTEFRNLCQYLYKITAKSFGQIQRHAQEVIDMWPGEEYQRFLDYLSKLASTVGGVHLVLSFSYENHFNAIVRGAALRGLDTNDMECSQNDHFELIGPQFLKEKLEGVL